MKEVKGRGCKENVLRKSGLPPLRPRPLASPQHWTQRSRQAEERRQAWSLVHVLVFCCCVTHHCKPGSLKHHPCTQSLEPVRCGWVSVQSITMLNSRYQPGREESTSKPTRAGRTQFLSSCGAEAHASLLAVNQGHSPFCLQASSGVLNPSHAWNL